MNNRRDFLKLAVATTGLALTIGPIPAFAGSDRSGKFSGRSNHVTKGKAVVTGNTVVLQSDFTFDGAPDARVGFGRNGKYDSSTDLGALKKLKGKQSYRIGRAIDTAKYNEVYIWCRKFNVPLGVAKLGR
ncbi:MAG: DM13 domain-containing protein [Roseibium sp.]|uniref:DM13 domain-containing protein n=1 Tax=Roseibium sp. TaxID=1936156 RepID=UPI001B2A2CC2|nr:DM13 domain-containing protein [Roseibium sp.]MBO6894760.1 DM13 domain-containing protein [Roseibium sp.]MBO6932319.1 DM13 domain-containing protein [Roseibium sp.]